ncbi:hypothetical protein B0T10DRAFT_570456 [Thelonectria olida]|uniref:NACHT-NTPase and P-loop NTPases N-terminal domain-containing protein n=1 Tax=Thelonectria olida TaxID=1576542 RepID=A0A9P9ATN4_9HYPO|nr:hypothetical protein B0T10DRAFT_570456 [Thelonectria olida]
MEVAASIVAFVQVAAEIAKCVDKSRKLWQHIKSLPTEFEDILSNIEEYGVLFEELDEQLKMDGTSPCRNDSSAKRSLKIAQRAVGSLHSLVEDISSQVTVKKGFQKKMYLAKIAIKKDRLDQYQARLSQSLDFLQMAFSVYHIVYNIVPWESEILQKVQDGDSKGVLELFRTRKASPFDRDDTGSSLLHYAARSKKYEMCKLLLNLGLRECLIEQGSERYDFLASLFVYFPNNSNRQARDTKPEDHWEKIVTLFHSYLDDPESTMVLRLFEFLQEWAYGDEFVLTFRERFLPKFYTGPLSNRLEAFRLGSFIMNGSHTLRSLLSTNSKISSSDVHFSTVEKCSLVHSVAVALGSRYADVDLPYKRLWLQGSIFGEDWSQLVAQVASVSTPEDLHSIETVSPWDIHHVPIWRGTPLISVIGGVLCSVSLDVSFVHWDNAIQSSIQRWVCDLKEAGVDLDVYGKRETGLLKDQMRGALDADAIETSRHVIRNKMAYGTVGLRRGIPTRIEGNENYFIPIRILDLKVGPSPDDWQVIWAPEFEWMACQFWKLVETVDIAMPGSWVDN